MRYDELLTAADREGLIVREKDLIDNDGRIKNRRVAIRKDMPTVNKACVLAEELGHWYTNVGDILDQTVVINRKQEHKARLWAYRQMIGLEGLISAFEHGCRNRYEIAEHLGVTEEFLMETLEAYHAKFGCCTRMDNYLIRFIPHLDVVRML